MLERGERADGWPWRMAERCVPALQGAAFGEYIDTEGRSIDEVVEHIVRRVLLQRRGYH